MMEDFAHADVHLEEDGEEVFLLDGNLKSIEGMACPVHAGKEVKDEVLDGGAVSRKRKRILAGGRRCR